MKVPPNPHECCSRTNPQKISRQNDARLYDKGTKWLLFRLHSVDNLDENIVLFKYRHHASETRVECWSGQASIPVSVLSDTWAENGPGPDVRSLSLRLQLHAATAHGC